MDTSHNCVNCLRLTSALARAHEALKGVVRIADRETVEFQEARSVLVDKSGTHALERWKAMEAVVEATRAYLINPTTVTFERMAGCVEALKVNHG